LETIARALSDGSFALTHSLPPWLSALIILGGAAVLALFLHSLAIHLLQLALRGWTGEFGRRLLKQIAAPTRLGVLMVALALALQGTPLAGRLRDWLEWSLLLSMIGFFGWAAATVLNTAADLYARRFPKEAEDSVLARKHLTQVKLLRRIAIFWIGFLTFAAMLMTIPAVREYGVSLFASAGVAGLVAGLAARPLLSNLIAGVQLALTQPIRLGDGVKVEGEFGHVEEIRSSYVVLRLWDLRRMVVPLSYFMERPFQNWTRDCTSMIGTVFLYVDFAIPVQAVREKFMELVRASELWDGQTAALQVTGASSDGVELRAIMSAATSGASFDLACEIREKLVGWLQETCPGALPQTRTSLIEQAAQPRKRSFGMRLVPSS
jgi:small-conductance mechanosensitive channel